MTFEEFSAGVRKLVWPEGEARELAPRHRAWIEDCLIDLQMKVECLHENHTSAYGAVAQFFHCGATIVTAPRGFIRRVWTELADEKCDRVFYRPVSMGEIECMTANRIDNNLCLEEPYGYYDGPVRGSIYAGDDPEKDKDCRAGDGYCAIHNGNLYLFPHLDNNEVAVVEWDGIKRSWEDDDIVTDDRDVRQAVEHYLTGFGAMQDDADPKRGALFYNHDPEKPGLYQLDIRNLIWRCRNERTIKPAATYCFDNRGGSGCGTCG